VGERVRGQNLKMGDLRVIFLLKIMVKSLLIKSYQSPEQNRVGRICFFLSFKAPLWAKYILCTMNILSLLDFYGLNPAAAHN